MSKKLIIGLLILLGVILASFTVTQAVTALYKQVTGVGSVEYSNEVDVTDLVVMSSSKIKVTITSTASTVAGYNYNVKLFLDGVATGGTQVVTWTSGQIPGTAKNAIFTGLSLGSVTAIGTEVTK